MALMCGPLFENPSLKKGETANFTVKLHVHEISIVRRLLVDLAGCLFTNVRPPVRTE